MTVTTGPGGSEYCADQVRRFDHDRWLTALFAPAPHRPALLALYAFNIEVARTAEQVSEPMLGEIRLQWWRESLEGIAAGSPREHPVVAALAAAIGEHRLDLQLFDQLIDARTQDLYPAPPADLAALEHYAAATSGDLTLLALQCLGIRDADSAAAGRHVGIAYALTGLLRAAPYLARRRKVLLPLDLLAEFGCDADTVVEDRERAKLRRVVARVAGAAAEHLAAARALRRRVAPGALPALLPGALAELYLFRLKRAGFDPYDRRLRVSVPRQQLRLLAKAIAHRF